MNFKNLIVFFGLSLSLFSCKKYAVEIQDRFYGDALTECHVGDALVDSLKNGLRCKSILIPDNYAEIKDCTPIDKYSSVGYWIRKLSDLRPYLQNNHIFNVTSPDSTNVTVSKFDLAPKEIDLLDKKMPLSVPYTKISFEVVKNEVSLKQDQIDCHKQIFKNLDTHFKKNNIFQDEKIIGFVSGFLYGYMARSGISQVKIKNDKNKLILTAQNFEFNFQSIGRLDTEGHKIMTLIFDDKVHPNKVNLAPYVKESYSTSYMVERL